MLKPAQIYKEQIQKECTRLWYSQEDIYYNGGAGNYEIDFSDNNFKQHQFASVDSHGNVIGYISYSVDWAAKSADNLGAISFTKSGIEFVRDLYKAVCNLFEVYHMNRVSWIAYADNPAVRGYRNFIKKHGGRECGYYRQVSLLLDGRLHDCISFEILAEEFCR